MSGGELDYLYSTLRTVLELNYQATTPQRKAFREHLNKVITALHDIEWVDSGDMGQGDENKAIMAALEDSESLAILIEEKAGESNVRI